MSSPDTLSAIFAAAARAKIRAKKVRDPYECYLDKIEGAADREEISCFAKALVYALRAANARADALQDMLRDRCP